jgi:prolyl oligopeptidase
MYTRPTGPACATTSDVPDGSCAFPMLRAVPISYPPARKVDQFDDYHGTVVSDPYRWMEDASDPDLDSWLSRQLAISGEFLRSIGCRDSFHQTLAGLTEMAGAGPPIHRGGRWFQMRSDPGAKPKLYVLEEPGDDGRVVFDTDVGGDVVVSDVDPSPDGTKLKWCESKGGSDWRTWHFLDLDSGERLPDVVRNAKLWSAWLPDSSGLLYTAFPSDGEGATRVTDLPQLKLHKLGSDEADELIYENPESPSYFFTSISDDGARIVLTFLYEPGSSIAWAPIDGPYDFRRIIRSDDQLWLVGTRGDELYVATTNDAPYGRVVAANASGEGGLREVVASSDVPLPMVAHAALVGGHVFVARDQLGRSTIEMHAIDGGGSYAIELPEVCRFVSQDVSEPVSVSPDGRSVWFTVTSPTSPATVLRHDVASRSTEAVFRSSPSLRLDVRAEVVRATSRDETKVPMTLVRDTSSSDASPPVLIFGYGGGGDSMEPYDFVGWQIAWMAAGGVMAFAHIRGGGELGAEWQAAAARGGKRLAMEDFIGCAEWLVDSGYTTAEHVAISGRSSGAMLAAAAVVARPELFAACVAEVGMFDPLRYHLFGLGRLMIPEYGTSEDATDFESMFAYSPLHNVKDGVRYPPMLLTVHTDDDRVMPGGPYKFAARLQEATGGDAPILLLVREGAGHHGGASIEAEIDERADILAFLGRALGVTGCSA